MTRGWPALPALALVTVRCSSGSRPTDPSVLVPWHRIGDIRLGERAEAMATRRFNLPASGPAG
jgi:hypothetical protein